MSPFVFFAFPHLAAWSVYLVPVLGQPRCNCLLNKPALWRNGWRRQDSQMKPPVELKHHWGGTGIYKNTAVCCWCSFSLGRAVPSPRSWNRDSLSPPGRQRSWTRLVRQYQRKSICNVLCWEWKTFFSESYKIITPSFIPSSMLAPNSSNKQAHHSSVFCLRTAVSSSHLEILIAI